MDARTQAMLRDPEIPFQDKAHLFERLDDTKAAYRIMVEGYKEQWETAMKKGELARGMKQVAAYDLAAEIRKELIVWETAGEVRQGTNVTLKEGAGRTTMRRKDGSAVVEPGTRGWVSWVGQRQAGFYGRGTYYGALVRVGEDRQTGFYARITDLEVDDPWITVKNLLAENERLEDACPVSGDQVRSLRSGRTGEVFWVSKPESGRRRRLGFLPDDPQEGDQISKMGQHAGKAIVWAMAAEVEVTTSWDNL